MWLKVLQSPGRPLEGASSRPQCQVPRVWMRVSRALVVFWFTAQVMDVVGIQEHVLGDMTGTVLGQIQLPAEPTMLSHAPHCAFCSLGLCPPSRLSRTFLLSSLTSFKTSLSQTLLRSRRPFLPPAVLSGQPAASRRQDPRRAAHSTARCTGHTAGHCGRC